jgi:FKBP-type peptidyl-prolyl cis-trans isomerase
VQRSRPLAHRPVPLPVIALLAAATACGGGDDRADAGSDVTAGTTAPAATAPGSIVGEAPGTTAAMPVVDPDRCEDEPVAADHPVDEMPVVLRPCTVPTELDVHVVHGGSGRPAENGDTLFVDYTGVRSASGDLFDTSYLRGVPLDFVLGRGSVILGWDVGLLGTRPGEVVKLDVPADMAYGDTPPQGSDIEAGDALTFLVEVRAVVPPTTAEDAPLDLLVTPSEGATAVSTVDATVGDGAEVTPRSTAIVHLLLVRGDNLKVLLDTWERGEPLQVPIIDDQSLPGIVTGLQGARVGSTRVITIPPDEAFGPDGEPGLGLPAGIDLIVVARVLGVY